VQRAGQAVPNPGADFVLAPGDVVYLLGCAADLGPQVDLFGPRLKGKP